MGSGPPSPAPRQKGSRGRGASSRPNDIQASIGSAPAFFLLQFNPGTEAGLHLTDLCLTPNYHMNGRERLQKALTPTDPPSPLPASLSPRPTPSPFSGGGSSKLRRGNQTKPRVRKPIVTASAMAPLSPAIVPLKFDLLRGRMRAAVCAFP